MHLGRSGEGIEGKWRRRRRTAEAMEAIFLEALCSGDGLVDRVGGDVRGYGAVESGVEEGYGFGVRKGRYAGFDHGEGSAVVSGKTKWSTRVTAWRKISGHTTARDRIGSRCGDKCLRR
jgi:hypothetical protein